MTETDALLVLNAIPGIGSARIRKLSAHYGSADRVLSLRESDFLADQIIPPPLASDIVRFPKDSFLKKEHAYLHKEGVEVITYPQESYPASLKEIPDAPFVLYVRGKIPEDIDLSVAIVGSRTASVYGTSVAEQFAARLAEAGVNIVSGMARGIDTAAHRGALRVRGVTVAVLGCGLAHIYPPENRKLFNQIIETGAVISEFPMETLPLAFNFPRRNRLISGLSKGVVVVEAAEKSGALITADCALEQGREVYAVPGKVDSPTSKGVHNLIKQGAKLVTCVEDILEDLHPQLAADLKQRPAPQNCPKEDTATEALTSEEQYVYRHIHDQPVPIDHLLDQCGSHVPSVSAVLLRLELKHLVKQLPGKLFVR